MQKDGIYFCNICDKEIAKGTGFSFPIENYHTHQECYYNKQKESANNIGTKTARNIANENIKFAKEMVKRG